MDGTQPWFPLLEVGEGISARAYTRAIGLEADPAVRRYLQNRLAACG